MRIPVVRGLIERRILVNFQVDRAVLKKLLPDPFRPKLIHGIGMAGICLIRLKHTRPRFVPGFLGISSENAAHRIAVEWEENGVIREGVFIPRRDTSSRLNSLVGGRLFPGVHHHARFAVSEEGNRYHVVLNSDDGQTRVAVMGHVTGALPSRSIFRSIQEASMFFERGSLGYSVTAKHGEFDGLELKSDQWHVEPLAVSLVESSFFEDQRVFSKGTVIFDSALLMRAIDHEWHGRPPLYSACPCD